MSSSANRFLPGLAAASGVGAFTVPFIAPEYLLIVFVSAIVVILVAAGRQKILFAVISFLMILFVLNGYLSAPVAAACLSVTALAITRRTTLAVGVLLLNLSATASIGELVGSEFARFGMEPVVPALMAVIVLVLVSSRFGHALFALISGVAAIGAVWLAISIVSFPEIALFCGALPALVSAFVLGAADDSPSRYTKIVVCIIMGTALSTWALTPPKSNGDTWVLLPNAPDAYEAKFFDNYLEALRFAGIKAKLASSPDEIPIDATVLMPWMTESIEDERQIGDLARKRRWTVIVAGEHTNKGEVATRIKAMTGRPLLRSDLSVPRGNTDQSGALRMPAISGWHVGSILNRGASVSIHSLADKVLLAGDGWWAEPDIEEWLWVGDYVWRDGDRAGRIALAVSADIGGARWVILGDNSPLINSQLIADPRAAINIIQAATLWPSFLLDILMLVFAIMILLAITPIAIVISTLLAGVVVMTISQPDQAWKDFYLGESGFDQRNFNTTIADNPSLVFARRLIRRKEAVTGKLELPSGPVTIFLLVDKSANFRGARLDNCHRIGSLNTSEGPYLMDAQACRVTGKAKILIGTEEAAAAIAIKNGAADIIVVLDTAFLGQLAPKANVKWLLQQFNR